MTIRSPSSSIASTGRRSSRPGRCAAPTRRSSTTRGSGRRARPAPRRAGAARPARRRRTPEGERGRWLLAGQQRRPRRHRRLVRRRRQRTAGDFRTLRQQMAKPDGRPNVALADFVAPPGPAWRTSSGPSRSRPGSASTRSSLSSRRRTTTTRRSSRRRSPTAWPRHSPSGSTSVCGASCGGTHPTRRSTTRT